MASRSKFNAQAETVRDLTAHLELSDSRITVISSEMFEKCSPKSVEKFRRLLEAAHIEVRILLIVRDLPSLLPSSFFQKVRYRSNTFDFDTFYEGRVDGSKVDYFSTAKIWADVFGWDKLVVRLLDRNFMTNGDLIDDFMLSAGVGVDDLRSSTARRPGPVNETSGWKIVEAARALYGGQHGLPIQHSLVQFTAGAPNLRKRKDLERAAVEVGSQMAWLGDKGLYLRKAQAKRALELFTGAIAQLNEHLATPFPTPLDLDDKEFVRRPFMPSASRIPATELRAFYDEVAEVYPAITDSRGAGA